MKLTTGEPFDNRLEILIVAFERLYACSTKPAELGAVMDKPQKVEIVGTVLTSSNEPWRMQGDYRKEQEEARERHAMFQEQHRLIQEQHLQLAKSYRLNVMLVLATFVAAAANIFSIFLNS